MEKHGANVIARSSAVHHVAPMWWTDKKVCGRNMYGPTLQAAYEQWKQSGRAAEVDAHKDAYLGYIQALL